LSIVKELSESHDTKFVYICVTLPNQKLPQQEYSTMTVTTTTNSEQNFLYNLIVLSVRYVVLKAVTMMTAVFSMWCQAVWWIGTNVSEMLAVFDLQAIRVC
jgi:hypothetical protein